MKGITAFDKEDGDLTSKVKVSGYINLRKPGIYELTYTVIDSKGGVRTAKSKVRVRYPVIIEEDNYDPTKNYVTGDIVVYKGQRYELIWHTGYGLLPGTNNLILKDLGPVEVEVPPVDIMDLARVAACYNMKKGDIGFDAECDRNNDNIIDIYDIVDVARAMK